jgi:hypothetical protein
METEQRIELLSTTINQMKMEKQNNQVKKKVTNERMENSRTRSRKYLK